mgnify:CR=1 FL=1
MLALQIKYCLSCTTNTHFVTEIKYYFVMHDTTPPTLLNFINGAGTFPTMYNAYHLGLQDFQKGQVPIMKIGDQNETIKQIPSMTFNLL